MNHFRWTVSQIGARQHYGVPRGFFHQGNLQTLYTDVWCRWGSSYLKNGPRGLRAFAGRYHPDLPSSRVISCSPASIWERLRSAPGHTTTSIYESYLRFGERFARWVTRRLERQPLDPACDAFFGFDTGCLETLHALRERGILTVVDQIDPARVEEELVFQESEKWPGWQEMPGRIPGAYFDRLVAEWTVADLVVVNSEWSKKALISQGVAPDKLLTVPIAYELTDLRPRQTKPVRHGPLNVLWLGTVNLRKGIPYLVGAARLLQRTDIRFVVAGPQEISREALASSPANISFVGRLTRDQTDDYYRQADIFVLPTISDGFAITQVEALAHGLPVITTPNCGQVVTHGIDGLLIPAGDARALAEAIAKLDADRALLRDMSRQAHLKALTFRLPKQAAQIEEAMFDVRRRRELQARGAQETLD